MSTPESTYLREWGARLRSEADNAPDGYDESARKLMKIAANSLYDGAELIEGWHADNLMAKGSAKLRKQIEDGK
jgi:hypothetical protein